MRMNGGGWSGGWSWSQLCVLTTLQLVAVTSPDHTLHHQEHISLESLYLADNQSLIFNHYQHDSYDSTLIVVL